MLIIFTQKGTRDFFYTLYSPIGRSIWVLGIKMSKILTHLREITYLQRLREDLEKENLNLRLKLSEIEVIKSENEKLKKFLNLKGGEEKIHAVRVVAKTIDDQDSLIVEGGLKDGIFEGEVALSEQKSLLGIVSKVYNNFSIVKLVSSKDFFADVKLPKTSIDALLQGRGKFNVVLTLLPKEENIGEGDPIFTSNLSGKFPSNIFVGEVKKINEAPSFAYKEAVVKLPFSLHQLDTVFLLTSFKPWEKK